MAGTHLLPLRVAVIGMGNPLLGDEGVGVRVLEMLASACTFPAEVGLVDAGTSGLGSIKAFLGREVAVVVDAMDGSGLPPGTIVRMDPAQIKGDDMMHGLHDMRLPGILDAISLAGAAPVIECVGIQVQDVSPRHGLTAPLEQAVPLAVHTVLSILGEHGVAARHQDAGPAEPGSHADRPVGGTGPSSAA